MSPNVISHQRAQASGMFWVNLIIALGFLLMVWYESSHLQQLNTPWTSSKPILNTTWRENLRYDDVDLQNKLMEYAGCNQYEYRDVYHGEFTFTGEDSSSACMCIRNYVSNPKKFPPVGENAEKKQDALRAEALRCMVGHRPAMKKTLHDKHGFWVSNPVVLVSLWNIISFAAYLFHETGRTDGKELSFNHNMGIIWQIAFLILSIFLMTMSNPLSNYVLGWHIAYVIAFYSMCWIVYGTASDISRSDWVFWIQITFTLPLAITIFNTSVQRRDLIFMITCYFISFSICMASTAAGLFARAWRLNEEQNTVTKQLLQKMKTVLGSDYSNIGNYTTLSNLVLVGSFLQIAYPTLVPRQALNVHGVAGISLVLVLLSIIMRGGDANHERVHYVRSIMEMVARSIISLAVLVDIISIRVL